ncbi:AAA family ATPase [Paucibacter sp. B2R-40]|uniref:ExeA family protein n=1 Tax=Paucibacter sp. B2R-40 TaxID=2893554 RepID=UPI0021E42246|nr:AAA family ATPase [Paucibacter sp. B2R-40]MCV2353430.1 AAA family ATPase [Paucibacter sp. B2R-40]
MYANFFGLKQEPFSIAPDPRYLYMSERHREALAHLLYGLRGGGGFVLLTGEIGAGKTTVCRAFLGQIPKRCNVAYIFNPKLSVAELLRTVCEEYGIQHHQALPAENAPIQSVKPFVDAINEFLLSTHAVGQNNVLIIDEAQNLSAEVLEQLRLLTNLETNERKLLQIILIGQPELRDMLAAPELEQLSQRVIARFHLPALSEAETGHYVRHRLGVAGFSAALPFEPKALRRIYQLSRGVPRRINLLCDRALLGAYSQDQRSVDRATVDRAAAEVFGPQDSSSAWSGAGRSKQRWALGASALLASAAVLAWAGRDYLHASSSGKRAPVVSAAVAPANLAKPATASAPASLVGKASPPSKLEVSNSVPGSLGLRSEAQAWQELAKSWQLEAPEIEPCQALAQQQLHCFRSLAVGGGAGDGGLSLLRLLDRPGILSLRDEAGKVFYVTLIKLDEQYATVRLGEQSLRISLPALSTQWRGEFGLLWRAPPGYPAKANGGPLLAWVDAQLAKAFAVAPSAGPIRLDASMRSRLAAFQRSQGLRSDGQLGPVTLMLLSRVGLTEQQAAANTAGAAGAATEAETAAEPRLQAGKSSPNLAAAAP